MRGKEQFITGFIRGPVLMICFVHNKTEEKFQKEYERRVENEINRIKKISGVTKIPDYLKLNVEASNFRGPWRFNDIYGYVSIEYTPKNKITSHHVTKHRNGKGKPMLKSGIYVCDIENPEIVLSQRATNEEIKEAIRRVIGWEKYYFKQKKKYLEYSEALIEHTDWVYLIEKWKETQGKQDLR
jgi:hypothetical protein